MKTVTHEHKLLRRAHWVGRSRELRCVHGICGHYTSSYSNSWSTGEGHHPTETGLRRSSFPTPAASAKRTLRGRHFVLGERVNGHSRPYRACQAFEAGLGDMMIVRPVQHL